MVFFTQRGFDVELIPESHIPRQRSADLIMTGMIWEMKAHQRALAGLKKLFILSKRAKRLKVITKQGELLEFRK